MYVILSLKNLIKKKRKEEKKIWETTDRVNTAAASFSIVGSLYSVMSSFDSLYRIGQAEGEHDTDKLDTSDTKCHTTQNHSTLVYKLLQLIYATLGVHIFCRTGFANWDVAATTPRYGSISHIVEVFRRIDATAIEALLNSVDDVTTRFRTPVFVENVLIHIPHVDVRFFKGYKYVDRHGNLYYKYRQQEGGKRYCHTMTFPNGTATSEESDNKDDTTDNDQRHGWEAHVLFDGILVGVRFYVHENTNHEECQST